MKQIKQIFLEDNPEEAIADYIERKKELYQSIIATLCIIVIMETVIILSK